MPNPRPRPVLRSRVPLVCALLGLALACGSSPREQLERMGIPFSVMSFLDAARAGDLHVVRLFLDAGMTPNGTDENRSSVLTAAAEGGDPDVVAALLAAGADPNVGDVAMRTPLMAAARAGHVEAARLLLEGGANANSLRDDGVTVLMQAARAGHADVVDALVSRGVQVDDVDQFGNTALMHAADGGHAEVVRALLDAGADPDRRTLANGAFALGLAAARDDEASAALLVAAGADLALRDERQKMTALAVAALKGSLGVTRRLLEAGADPEARDADDNTPLIIAANAGHLEVVRALLARGAAPDARGAGGTTALMFAALKGHADVVDLLLEAGADPSLETEGRYSAILAAKHEGHEAIARHLRRAALAAGGEHDAPRRWSRFALYGDAYATPRGWTAVDPFTSEDFYWGESTLVGIDAGEGPRTRRALLRDPASRSQVFLLRGSLVEWMPKLLARAERLDGEPGVDHSEHRLLTADGVTVEYLVVERPATGFRHWLGVAELGREVFLVDAGGPAQSFDRAAVEALVRSVHVRGGQLAPPAPAKPSGVR